jgi:coenzyme F420-reducing hydrogenase delta subunit
MENAVKDGLTYDAEAVVLPVKCTGLIKVSYLLKLFAKGIRGVLVLGCDEGDCRYYNGSARCAEIVGETREILDLAGVKPDRLQFHTIAESGGQEAKRVLKGFLKQFGKVSRAVAKGNGGGKPKRKTGTTKAKKKAKPKPKAKRAASKKKKTATRTTKRKQAGGTKKTAKAKRTGRAKRKQAAGKAAATTKRGKTAGSKKPTRGTGTVKARKGKKRGSSRRH